jgi:hypothetical protein
MAMGGHGLPEVSLGPTMPYLSTPCGQATPIIAIRPFQGWLAHRAGDLRRFFPLLDTPRRKSMTATRNKTNEEKMNQNPHASKRVALLGFFYENAICNSFNYKGVWCGVFKGIEDPKPP